MELELTQGVIDRLVDYQLGFQYHEDGPLLRGQISCMEITGEGDERRLIVHFLWLAKQGDVMWEETDPQEYEVYLGVATVSDKGNGLIIITSETEGFVTLCPPGNSTLKWSQVRKLQLAA
jgi:hypothetical protein